MKSQKNINQERRTPHEYYNTRSKKKQEIVKQAIKMGKAKRAENTE